MAAVPQQGCNPPDRFAQPICNQHLYKTGCRYGQLEQVAHALVGVLNKHESISAAIADIASQSSRRNNDSRLVSRLAAHSQS